MTSCYIAHSVENQGFGLEVLMLWNIVRRQVIWVIGLLHQTCKHKIAQRKANVFMWEYSFTYLRCTSESSTLNFDFTLKHNNLYESCPVIDKRGTYWSKISLQKNGEYSKKDADRQSHSAHAFLFILQWMSPYMDIICIYKSTVLKFGRAKMSAWMCS